MIEPNCMAAPGSQPFSSIAVAVKTSLWKAWKTFWPRTTTPSLNSGFNTAESRQQNPNKAGVFISVIRDNKHDVLDEPSSPSQGDSREGSSLESVTVCTVDKGPNEPNSYEAKEVNLKGASVSECLEGGEHEDQELEEDKEEPEEELEEEGLEEGELEEEELEEYFDTEDIGLPLQVDLYDQAIRLPFVQPNLWIYPKAMTLFHEEAFKKYETARNVILIVLDFNPDLRDRLQQILVQPYICGENKEDAGPCVVIKLHQSLFQHVRRVLSKEHIRRQIGEPQPNSLKNLLRSSNKKNISPTRLRLVYWIVPEGTQLVTHSAQIKVVRGPPCKIHVPSTIKSAPTGVNISCGHRQATIALVVQIEKRLFALTAAHLFLNVETSCQEFEQRGRVEDETFYSLADETSEAFDLWDDCLDYDLHDLDFEAKEAEIMVELPSDRSARDSEKDSSTVLPASRSLLTAFTPEIITSENINGGADWALLELPGSIQDFHDISGIAISRFPSWRFLVSKKTYLIPIVIICGGRNAKTGVLVPGYSIFKSDICKSFCRAHRIMLDGSQEIEKGDSGALVLTRKGFSICGHIIASTNPGEGFMAPIDDTLSQIEKSFGSTSEVKLSRVVPLMVNYKNLQFSTFEIQPPSLNHIVAALSAGRTSRSSENWFDVLELQIAAGAGDLDKVSNLLEKGYNVNSMPVGFNGRTPLQAAVEHGHLSVIDFLLSQGADANPVPQNSVPFTTLQIAALSGRVSTVERILRESIDVNQESDLLLSKTALVLAVEAGHVAVVRKLIDAGADVNHVFGPERERTSVLVRAIQLDRGRILEALVFAGADIGPRRSLESPLVQARESTRSKTTQTTLQKGADPPSRRRTGKMPLQIATELGRTTAVKLLVAAGAVFHDASFTQDSFLHAIDRWNPSIIDALLVAGADPNKRRRGGNSVLFESLWRGEFELAGRLLRRGASIVQKEYHDELLKSPSIVSVLADADLEALHQLVLALGPRTPGESSLEHAIKLRLAIIANDAWLFERLLELRQLDFGTNNVLHETFSQREADVFSELFGLALFNQLKREGYMPQLDHQRWAERTRRKLKMPSDTSRIYGTAPSFSGEKKHSDTSPLRPPDKPKEITTR